MGPDRDAAGSVDAFDRLAHRRDRPASVGRTAGQQVCLQDLFGSVQSLSCQPLGIRGVLEHRPGKMRPPDRGAGGDLPVEHLLVDREAEFLQRVAHPVGARGAIGPVRGQRVQQLRRAMLNPVAEDVQILVVSVDGGDLDGRNHADPVARPGAQRFGHAGHRVVVGEGEQLNPILTRPSNDLLRSQRAVRVGGMRLQIEARASAIVVAHRSLLCIARPVSPPPRTAARGCCVTSRG